MLARLVHGGATPTAGAYCPPPHLSSLELEKAGGANRARAANAAFFLTGRAQFWGSAFHLEYFIDAVKTASSLAAEAAPEERNNGTVLVDVGAAPYNVVGGDISHVLTYQKHWKASSGATILAFEPGGAPFGRLVQYVSRAVGEGHAIGRRDDPHSNTPTVTIAPKGSAREWIVLRNSPASDRSQQVRISNQPYAGDNTASLEPHYQAKYAGGGRVTRSVTLDGELRRRGLSDKEILILKVDVEGHEMAVLRGARQHIAAGLVTIILVEYGDKMSPAIWDAMKRRNSGAAAAPSPQELPGPSLHRLQTWASERGYDSFLVGAAHRKPVLIPLTGGLWRDEYEVCRDKSQKWSPNGRIWQNFSAWNPMSSAVCWYDVALIHRTPKSPKFRKLLLQSASLPPNFCKSVEKDHWYPHWIDRPPPTELCCTHTVLNPRNGDVCHSFKNCTDTGGGRPGGGGAKGGGKGGGGAKLGKATGKLSGKSHALFSYKRSVPGA